MAKRTPRQIAKDNAWKAFSIYIRTRDCLRFTGDPERGKCVTCLRPYPFAQLQAGHFVDGRNNAVLFDEEACYAQCYGCNVGKYGAKIAYFVFMEKEWGREYLDEIVARSKQTVKYKVHEFEEIEEKYKHKVKEILGAKDSVD